MRSDDRRERHTELTCVFFFLRLLRETRKGGYNAERDAKRERCRNEKI